MFSFDFLIYRKLVFFLWSYFFITDYNFLWFFNVDFYCLFFLPYLHSNGFSSVWIFLCWFWIWWSLWENIFSEKHAFIRPLWILSCHVEPLLDTKIFNCFLQYLDLWNSSPIWFIWCGPFKYYLPSSIVPHWHGMCISVV